MMSQTDVYVGAGSNIDPVDNLRVACRELEQVFGPLALSSVYRTAPIGFDGPDFLNMVIAFSTRKGWAAVNTELARIQVITGREIDTGRYTSRTLDLDLLLYGDLVIDGPEISLPRSDITRYAFVLRPLAELAPDLEHPVKHATMRELLDQFNRDQAGDPGAGNQPIERLGDIHQPILRPPSTEII
jgi:2-amino-4-hydroxy-6-hydroxymethyldihydropteridine diphosphokinase